MVKKVALAAVCLILCFAVACSENPAGSSANVRNLTSLEKRIVESDNTFGFNLMRQINGGETENIFISPVSVAMALGMTLNGADGETKTAMEHTLHLSGLSNSETNETYRSLIDLLRQLDHSVIFQIANSIWYRQDFSFEQQFIDVNKTYFDAEVAGLDFDDPSAVDIINDWVSNNTNGKIDRIIEEIESHLVMFLINAIYFNGTWTYEFDKENTRDDRFTLPDGSQKGCKMMIQTNEFQYKESDDYQAIDLPYGEQGLYRMTVFLPYSSADLNDLIDGLSPAAWKSHLSGFKADSVTLEMPKFKIEYEVGLNDALTALGMGIAFAEGLADFTRMHPPDKLYIDYVKHKTFVEVDEEGTEAAAVTVVAIGVESAGNDHQIKFMRIVRPFFFVIREVHSGTILFMGKIVEPLL